jgi:two-component system OmpR family response regulator
MGQMITSPSHSACELMRNQSSFTRTPDHEDASAAQEDDLRGILQFGNLTLDLTRREIRLDGNALPFTPKEYELMVFLVQHHGQALSRELLLSRVWTWESSNGTRTVDVHIHGLREKIEFDPDQPSRIVTVRGLGYRFEG